MKKKRALVIGAEIAIVAGFSFAFYQYVQNEVQPTEVYQFKHDLEANTKVTKDDLKVVTVPASAVTKDFAVDAKDVVGKYVSTDVFADTYVYKQALVEKDDLDPFKSLDLSKLRTISIPVNLETASAGQIKKGDKVDLMFTGEGEKDNKSFIYSKVFLQNVYVYSVTTDEGYAYVDTSNVSKSEAEEGKEGKKISTSAEDGSLANVTLAVTLEQAEEISARLKSGEVRLLGRFDDSESYETLGYVVGEFGKVFAEQANAETGRATINEDE